MQEHCTTGQDTMVTEAPSVGEVERDAGSMTNSTTALGNCREEALTSAWAGGVREKLHASAF